MKYIFSNIRLDTIRVRVIINWNILIFKYLGFIVVFIVCKLDSNVFAQVGIICHNFVHCDAELYLIDCSKYFIGLRMKLIA